MEHAEVVEQPLGSHSRLVGLALGLVEDGLATVEAFEHVGSEATRRLVGHLDAIPEHESWEDLRGIRAQPKSERGVRCLAGVCVGTPCLLRGQLVTDLLEMRHP